MFGMYLKPFRSVSSFKISSWTFLCGYFCLYVPGTLIDKLCLHILHVTIVFHFFVIFIASHDDTTEGSIRIIFLLDLCPQKWIMCILCPRDIMVVQEVFVSYYFLKMRYIQSRFSDHVLSVSEMA